VLYNYEDEVAVKKNTRRGRRDGEIRQKVTGPVPSHCPSPCHASILAMTIENYTYSMSCFCIIDSTVTMRRNSQLTYSEKMRMNLEAYTHPCINAAYVTLTLHSLQCIDCTVVAVAVR